MFTFRWFPRSLSLLFAPVFLLTIAMAAVGAQDNANQEAIRLDALRKVRLRGFETQMQAYNRLPKLADAYDLAALVQIRHDENQWKCEVKLPKDAPKNRQFRADINGLKGVSLLNVSQAGKGTYTFNLQNISFDEQTSEQSNLTMSCSPQNFYVTKSKSNLDGNSSVSFSSNLQIDESGQPRLIYALNVNNNNNNGIRKGLVNVSISAPSFSGLRHQSPLAFNECLRPVLRELSLDSVLAADAQTAWQVFSSSWEPNEKSTNSVNALLTRLDSDDFQEREEAAHALATAGEDVALALVHIDRSTLSPQQIAVFEQVLAPRFNMTRAEAERLSHDTDFLLDCLYCDNPRTRSAALDKLKSIRREARDFNLPDGDSERCAAIEKLRDQIDPPPATRPAKGKAARADPKLEPQTIEVSKPEPRDAPVHQRGILR